VAGADRQRGGGLGWETARGGSGEEARSRVVEKTGALMGRQPPRRIVVVGSTGSGKTTLASQLARRLALPHVELDALHWEPNWTMAPLDRFRQRVEEALNGEGWVVDGGYGKVRDIVWGRAETLVWLDYGLPVILWRLLKRTLRR